MSSGDWIPTREAQQHDITASLDDVTSLAVEILAGKTRGGWSSSLNTDQ